MLPDESISIPVGKLSAVLVPEIVVIGAMFPDAPEAYSVMELALLAIHMLPDESSAS